MVRRGFLPVDPALLASILAASESTRSVRMSAMGRAWHQEQGEKCWAAVSDKPFFRAAVELTGEDSPPTLVRWWSSVLRSGAEYKSHKHDGKWAFVYHLTDGAAVCFEGGESFRATPGQLLVFESSLVHWTDKVDGDAPRVSIAGNLYFSSKRNR